MVHDTSFREDPLRMLRGARFTSQHGLAPDPQTFAAMRRDSPGMTALTQKGVSGTVQEELRKLLMGTEPGKGLRLMRDTGMLQSLLPELAPMVGFEQRSI
jgi:tRNA nucleotidyltransferase/poly(A) polymerase